MGSANLVAVSIIERVGSVFSLLGCLFIITTFCSSKAFHKPINRLFFYASFGNLMSNVATLMARSFIGDTNAVGCQLQGFLLQMFMPADAFWALSMAVNVYLTFYCKFDSQKLRKMELPYLALCYGIPFTIALVFTFISTPTKGKMYGDAIMWCWISKEWGLFRIACFYAPVWVAILITIGIYIRAGNEIYQNRQQLKHFADNPHLEPSPPTTEEPCNASITTEVTVTSETGDRARFDFTSIPRRESAASSALTRSPGVTRPAPAYSVSIVSEATLCNRDVEECALAPVPTNVTTTSAEAPRRLSTFGSRRREAYEANSAAWSYTKCAILFFVALIVTWIPSSANRVYGILHNEDASAPLVYMSALVLPLQGLWNSLIYMVTSWKACLILADEIRVKTNIGCKPSIQELVVFPRNENSCDPGNPRQNLDSEKEFESESMMEFAHGRQNSSEHRKGSV